MSPNTHKAERFENIAHYLAAFTVILKGLDKIENPEKVGIGILFIAIGIVICLGTFFHHKASRLLKHFKAYVLVFEIIVMAVVGYMYMAEGKQYLQYVCFATVALFFVALIVYIRKRKSFAH
ncbi:MAG TPA: hypothetical protein VD927_07845 [Chryseosolibacter sp.]|nr:hypothetical protein [Chryseosolibacter sp.]